MSDEASNSERQPLQTNHKTILPAGKQGRTMMEHSEYDKPNGNTALM